MDRVKHRKYKHQDAADLDVTPFMNLMIVLVPVLLLSMVFTLSVPWIAANLEFFPGG